MQIHWYQLLFQIINFSILIWGLNKFLYKPIIKILEQRNKKIQDGINAAEKNLEEKAKLAEFEKLVKIKAEKEATKILNEAKKQADQRSKEFLLTTKLEAEGLVAKEFKNLKEKLKDEEAMMKNRIGELVINTTQAILGKTLTAKDQHRIIGDELKILKDLQKK
ncbi:F0F1 ATP synthase subunit B [Patescibacteria group bacterium]|nr:F0F1 ATP synthase subunit B [Patescibacteria group bacterium]MBU1885296.1 F0F1 ATP synthase subunit B [Patescibacteria group bacterium]